MPKEVILTLQNISLHFGGIKAINDVSMQFENQKITAVIGPNGAGKTTLFNIITGNYKPQTGSLTFKNIDLNKHDCHEITKLGIARTFQNIRLFKNLSVLDNLKVAFHVGTKYGPVDILFKNSAFKHEEKIIEEEAMTLLRLIKLEHKKDLPAASLSYGEQRKLELVRTLATKPKIILLDEPAAGMNPTETKELTELIKKIKVDFNLAIILIEHDMGLVMDMSDEIYVLDYGVLIAQGKPSEIQKNPQVIQAYLGISEGINEEEHPEVISL